MSNLLNWKLRFIQQHDQRGFIDRIEQYMFHDNKAEDAEKQKHVKLSTLIDKSISNPKSTLFFHSSNSTPLLCPLITQYPPLFGLFKTIICLIYFSVSIHVCYVRSHIGWRGEQRVDCEISHLLRRNKHPL